ncbi:MAG: hypothetical protein KDJ35_07220 [Alphaproteobacteria bacterium]|nr:hypothetical protein [Alphaproteobacteria bacterium]
MSKKKTDKKDEGVTFDMYHLFSRWDLVLVLAFIIAVLLVTLYFVMFGERVV